MLKEIGVLREFLNMSIFSPDEVFEKFETDKDGKTYKIGDDKFYFKMGTRKDKILLVAHADTIWDKRYSSIELAEDVKEKGQKQNPRIYDTPKLKENLKQFYSGSKMYGLGADDRAGAAIVWLLKDTGNSVLITDKEEIGAFSARSIMENEEFRKIIDSHRYILQFDLQGKKTFKCYGAGSEDFKVMMEMKTKYDMLPNFSFTDIAVLGQTICGANLATGYKFEHSSLENVNKLEWYRTFKIAKKLSQEKHQQFYVEPDFAYKHMRDSEKQLFEGFGEEFTLYDKIDQEMDIDEKFLNEMNKIEELEEIHYNRKVNLEDNKKSENVQEAEPGM